MTTDSRATLEGLLADRGGLAPIRQVGARQSRRIRSRPNGQVLLKLAENNEHLSSLGGSRSTGFALGVWTFGTQAAAYEHAQQAVVQAIRNTQRGGRPGGFARFPRAADLLALAREIDEQGVPCVLIGAFALYGLGYFRQTSAIDLLVSQDPDAVERFVLALQKAFPGPITASLTVDLLARGAVVRVACDPVIDVRYVAGEHEIPHGHAEDYADIVELDGAWMYSLLPSGVLLTQPIGAIRG